MTDTDFEALSPMMQKYIETKKEHSDCILFYRLGDFYEMFFDDALTVSKELELTLTGKNCGLKERAPMCGVPYHAVETYINKLVLKGYKVAVCDQMEDPKTAKGIVRREVTRIVTPGTNLDTYSMDETRNNYIMCVFSAPDCFGTAAADVTTGQFYASQIDDERRLLDEISRFMPSEIVCNEAFLIGNIITDDLKDRLEITVYTLDPWYFDDENSSKVLMEHFKVNSISGLGLSDMPSAAASAGALLKYLYDTQMSRLSHINTIIPYQTGKFMMIDSSTRRNLELTQTMREKQKRGSLLWVLDKTKTAMGARMLRSYIEQPLLDRDSIEKRLDAVETFIDQMITREEIREYLTPVYDLERLISRVIYKTANPRDLISLKVSLSMLPHIKVQLAELSGSLIREIESSLDTLDDIRELIETSIEDEPPISVRDGGIIRSGYNEYADSLRSAKTEGKNWLAKIEEEEREKTGIRNLRIKYNKVFGYYLEVTNSNKDLVPDYYMRKQTLTNSERYITPKLKELEETILGAEDKLTSLEYDLFCEIREKIAGEVVRIQNTAKAVAKIDVFSSLAAAAEQNNYVRPSINENGVINIKGGRHPVVEKMMGNDMFIENDTYLDSDENRISIITGPNMAGKSTYMRQSALIVLMAQIGSFVPASSADICIADRIFTRVGASDDLASGQSTFMVEMNEVANILHSATKDSLLILDEIGRGTSTIDGLAIARAVVEHISDTNILGAKTLFATHYHELTSLEGKLPNVRNYCIAVKEKGDDIVFLRKIIPGGADKSYGIQVARLAGVPDSVINRAKEICAELENEQSSSKEQERKDKKRSAKDDSCHDEMRQMTFFDFPLKNETEEEIRAMDLSNITPIEALNKLYELQSKLK